MCEFISVKKIGDKLYYLTATDIESKRGKELRDWSQDYDDLRGHGSVDFFYDLKGKGESLEFTDFSSPRNFPPELVRAIITGKFRRWFGPVPKGLLKTTLYDSLLKEKRALLEAYIAKERLLWEAYDAKLKPLLEAYNAKLTNLYEQYWLLLCKEENRATKWKSLK